MLCTLSGRSFNIIIVLIIILNILSSVILFNVLEWQACESRCSQQMRHSGEHTVLSRYILALLSMELERYTRLYLQPHRCQYSQQYENKIYTCQRCQVHWNLFITNPNLLLDLI